MARRVVAVSLILVLVLALLTALNAEAPATGRIWTVMRLSGPAKNSVVTDSITPLGAGKWSVTVSNVGLTSLTVSVYKGTVAAKNLVSSETLDFTGNPSGTVTSRQVPMKGGVTYRFTFAPSGTVGTYAIVAEQFVLQKDLPPVASFTVAIDQTRRLVNLNGNASYDPDGTITVYTWNLGNGQVFVNAGSLLSYTYAADGTYTITLTVTDNGGFTGSASQTVTILKPDLPPVATFIVTQDGLNVAVNAGASYDPDGTIIRYQWDWGDGSPNATSTGPLASHTYLAPGTYTIYLEVMDNAYLASVTFQSVTLVTVTPNTFYQFTDFFNVPYGEWWDIRTRAYNDRPINANCFNMTSITDGVCTVANPALPPAETYPFTNWYPAPFGPLFYQQPGNDPFVYAPYRMHVVGTRVSGYNLSQPVFLPVLNTGAAPGTSLTFRWDMQYMTLYDSNALTAAGCPGVKASLNDGFMLRSRIALTMDAQEARRVFGLPASATTPSQISGWFAGQTTASCSTNGPLETAVSNWFSAQANGKYDIWNAFQYAYTPFFTNISEYTDAYSTVHVAIDTAAWGTEVFLARLFYWGNASYVANVLDSRGARGFLGMEAPWFEDLHFTGNLASAITFDLRTAVQYHFKELASPGPDGTYRSATNGDTDDVSYWTWGPVLADIVPASTPHPSSELSRWTGLTYVHSTPGAISYGLSLPYDYAPTTWNLGLAQNWSFEFPTGLVPFVNVAAMPIPANPQGQFSVILAHMALLGTNPPAYGSWTPTGETWVIIGPSTTGGPLGSPGSYPLQPFGAILLRPA